MSNLLFLNTPTIYYINSVIDNIIEQEINKFIILSVDRV